MPLIVESQESVEEFCEKLGTLSTDTPTEPSELYALYDEIIDTAPPELAADTTEFVRLSRGLSESIEPFLDDPDRLRQAMTELDPELRVFLDELLTMTESGTTPDTPTGRLVSWQVATCTE